MRTPFTRTVSTGFATLGLLTLAACATAPAASAPTREADPSTAPHTGSAYADGVYTAKASYLAPSGTETILVELTVADDTVTAVSVSQDAVDHEAREFQAKFASGISAEVVGKSLAELNVTRVAGSSLTSHGFNAAVEDIRAQAI